LVVSVGRELKMSEKSNLSASPVSTAATSDRRSFEKSRRLGSRLATLVPGGGHTYAKGADQYPELSPGVIERGLGCHVWDADGNEYIEYGMGLRSVTLGHAYPPVVEAVSASLVLGTNFTRPSVAELECAEQFLAMIPNAEMVKFTKDGSSATSAAVKLARRATGRDTVALCAEHQFFSYDDWFISTTTMDGGIPAVEREMTASFHYNDLASVRAMFDAHPGAIAAVILEPVRTDAPVDGFLDGLRELCTANGAILVFDEMITGFRYALRGAQDLFGVTPDLSTFGKGFANGFALSALCGRRDLMMLGSHEREEDDVFLLSTTHGAETTGLAAAMATMSVCETEPVIEHLDATGTALAMGLRDAAAANGVADHVMPIGFPCNLVYATLDGDGNPSQAFRCLFLQEMIRRGVLMPSLVVSYSHDTADVDQTVAAFDGALSVYARALEDGVEHHLVGRPSRHVFERRWG
jgi:glutamate-1-semialdehyde 2,1-aminomutase